MRQEIRTIIFMNSRIQSLTHITTPINGVCLLSLFLSLSLVQRLTKYAERSIRYEHPV
jgi:hypothetical protein